MSFRLTDAEAEYGDIDYNPLDLVRATGPGSSSSPDIIAYAGSSYAEIAAFDDSSDEYVGTWKEIPHDYAEGTDLSIHIHWGSAAAAPSGDVRWNFVYQIRHPDGTNTTVISETTVGLTAATPTAQWDLKTHELGTITGTNIKIGDQIVFDLIRDANNAADTMTGDAIVSTIGLHYKRNSLGSEGLISKDS
jgi:hypothetical protein